MSDFYDAIDAYYNSTTESDRLGLVCASALEIGFESATVRLWQGYGRAFTPDGKTWLGFHSGIGEDAQSYVTVPSVADGRDGSSPTLEISLGYIEESLYNELREMEETVDGRPLTIYKLYFDSSGMRSPLPPGDAMKLTMLASKFSETRQKMDDGSHRILRRVSVTAKNNNQGRSLQHFGAMNSVGQRFRSQSLFGVQDDAFADYTSVIAGGIALRLS